MHYERLIKNRIYIFTAHDEMQESADMAYPFRQEPVFYWLASINEPGWGLVVNMHTMRLTLLRPERAEVKTLFEGSLSDAQVAAETGIEDIIPWSQRKAFLTTLASQYNEVYALKPLSKTHYDFVENPAVRRLWSELTHVFNEVLDCRQDVARLRALKQEKEVKVLQRAVNISIKGFETLKQQLAAMSYEYEAEAVLSSEFRRTGGDGHAYMPIVAGGKNACTLHYSTNNDALTQSSLLLIDAAAKVDGYAADITRTYAIGTPTQRQIAVHKEVESAHHKIIDLIKPGLSVKAYLDEVDEIMKDALQELGLLHHRDDQETYRKYFPHAISHGLGIDVHESLGGFKEFKPGMVLTVEPGIYIPEEGIGVRIEDDILVTVEGHENLSAALPTGL